MSRTSSSSGCQNVVSKERCENAKVFDMLAALREGLIKTRETASNPDRFIDVWTSTVNQLDQFTDLLERVLKHGNLQALQIEVSEVEVQADPSLIESEMDSANSPSCNAEGCKADDMAAWTDDLDVDGSMEELMCIQGAMQDCEPTLSPGSRSNRPSTDTESINLGVKAGTGNMSASFWHVSGSIQKRLHVADSLQQAEAARATTCSQIETVLLQLEAAVRDIQALPTKRAPLSWTAVDTFQGLESRTNSTDSESLAHDAFTPRTPLLVSKEGPEQTEYAHLTASPNRHTEKDNENNHVGHCVTPRPSFLQWGSDPKLNTPMSAYVLSSFQRSMSMPSQSTSNSEEVKVWMF